MRFPGTSWQEIEALPGGGCITVLSACAARARSKSPLTGSVQVDLTGSACGVS